MIPLIGRGRGRLLIYLSLTILAFGLLASGISELQLKSGAILFKPVERVQVEAAPPPEAKVTPYTPTSPQSILGMLAIAAGLATLFAAYRSPQVRAGMITLLIFVSLYLGIIYLYRILYEPAEQEEQAREAGLFEQQRLPEEAFENPPDVVDWVSRATTGGIVLAASGIGWLAWRQRRRWLNHKPPLEIIADEVETTLADIRAGANLKDAVTRCYFDMGQALRKGSGLVRQDAVTPREFEVVLEQAGLPGPAVQQLTRLFEKSTLWRPLGRRAGEARSAAMPGSNRAVRWCAECPNSSS